MLVMFAEWRPDVAELNSGFAGDVLNALSADGSYIPAPSFAAVTSALEGVCLGGFLARELDGTITIFAGTADKLWVLDNNTQDWTDASQTGVTYGANDVAQWSFAQFGPYVIAVNVNDDPQVFELGASAEFADLGGNPPRAAYVKVWGDFVALLDLADYPNRVHWSGLNDATEWTPGTNNSDYQEFPDGGAVQGSTEATNPLIFQERAIRRATFVPGSVEIFTFQKVHDLRGVKSPYSIASRGALAFYADEGGFFQIGSDGALTPVGFEKVDRTVFGQLASADIGRIYGAVDPFFSRVYWAVDYGATGAYNHIIVYDFNLGRFSQIKADVQLIFPAATPGYTLEGLDSISASLDSLPFSLDSKVWQGGAPVLAGFDSQNRMGFFSGPSLEATLTTSEAGSVDGGIVRTSSVYPVVDTNDARVTVGFRFRRGDAVNWLPEQAQSTNTGRVRKRSRGRFHRFKVRVPAGDDWSHAQGVDVAFTQAGER